MNAINATKIISLALLALFFTGCAKDGSSKDTASLAMATAGAQTGSTSNISENISPDLIACTGQYADPTGCVVAKCRGTLAQPRVELHWCSNPQANSNSIEKGDSYPNDPNRFWAFVYQDATLQARDWIDTAVTTNIFYTYRVKYRPDLPSQNVNVYIPANTCSCGNQAF
jgi:hypothetical protein